MFRISTRLAVVSFSFVALLLVWCVASERPTAQAPPAGAVTALTGARFETIMEPREEIIHRAPPERGFWAQWEAVYRRR